MGGGNINLRLGRLSDLSRVLLLWLLFLSPLLGYAQHSGLRAIRRGESVSTMRDMCVGARVGGQISFLRTGVNSEFSTPYIGYQYGFELLIPVNDNFEIQMAALGSWKGGTLESRFGAYDGGIPITTRIRIMSVNLSLFVNYIRREGLYWDFYGGIGIVPQVQATGRMELEFAGGTQSHDLNVGFNDKDHIFPLNFGLGVHIGARYHSQFALSLWYEHDFLNLLPKQKRFYGAVTPDFLLRHDFSRPYIQSLDKLATLAGGISFVYYIKL